MSLFAFDPELEQKLNDIDDFIRSQCGDLTAGFDQSEWLLPSQVGEAPVQSSSWTVKAETRFPGTSGATTEVLSTVDPCAEHTRPEVRVEVLNLMDIYDKKTFKSSGKYEHRTESSEVTIVARAAEEIKKVRVYVQRCPETTQRAHDTTGLVELRVKLQHHDQLQTVLSVDLGSVHRAHEGNTDYRLDKADITQRNNWELVIMVGLHTGVISTVKSKPFRITTRSIQKAKSAQQDISNAVQDDLQEIPSECLEGGTDDSATDSNFLELPAESFDTNSVVNRVASKLRQELSKFHLNDAARSPTQSVCRTDPLVFGKVVLRPDTTLDMKKVSTFYNRDVRARYVVEQPDLPVLLKLMSRNTTCTSGGRRRANGFKTAEEDFWWACGLCFFERRKKSTVKAHVAQRVCQKTSLRKEMRQRKKAMGHLKRYASCEFSSERFEGFEQFAWNSPLSV